MPSVSIGVGITSGRLGAHDLIAIADHAMLETKRGGGGVIMREE